MPAPVIRLHPDRIPRRWCNLAGELQDVAMSDRENAQRLDRIKGHPKPTL